MSGLQLVAQLRSMGRDDFVVGVTGNALRSGKLRSLWMSFAMYQLTMGTVLDQEEYIEAGVDRWAFILRTFRLLWGPNIAFLIAVFSPNQFSKSTSSRC